MLHDIYIFTWLFFVSKAKIVKEEADKVTSKIQKPSTLFIERRRERIRRIVEKSDKEKAKIMKRKEEWEKL